jgi:hypothetical protein
MTSRIITDFFYHLKHFAQLCTISRIFIYINKNLTSNKLMNGKKMKHPCMSFNTQTNDYSGCSYPEKSGQVLTFKNN